MCSVFEVIDCVCGKRLSSSALALIAADCASVLRLNCDRLVYG